MNCKTNIKYVKYIFIVLFILYLFLLSYLVFFSPNYGRNHFERNLNLIPFKNITIFLTKDKSIRVIAVNIFGNILAFGPMGFLLPIIFPKTNKLLNMLILCTLISVFIEAIQYATAVGASDVDDVILNVFGGFLGILLYKTLIILLNKKIN